METKRLITLMMISFVVIFGWQLLIFKLYPPKPPGTAATTAPSPTTTVATSAPTTSAAITQATAATVPTATQAVVEATTTTSPTKPPPVGGVSAATQPSTVTLGNETGYPMVVHVNSRGAGLDSVALKEFRGTDRKGDFIFQEPYVDQTPDGRDNTLRALAARSININGNDVSLWDVDWKLQKQDGVSSATYGVEVGPVKLRRTYEVAKSPKKGDHSEIYDLIARYSIENTGPAPVKVKLSFNGPTTPPHENERGGDVQTLGGYDNGYGSAAVTHTLLESFTAKKPTYDLTKGDHGEPLLWAGAASVYFNAILRPTPLDPKAASPTYIANVSATALHPDATMYGKDVAITFDTTELTIDPAKTLDLQSQVYLGPRMREVLAEPRYASFPLDFRQTLVLTSGPCAFCTFGWLVDGLVWLLAFFHMIFRDWGLAIIALVILVRSLLHPITKRSQVAMMRMGKMGPEIERLKKKYADDKDELNRQMMGLYKEQGVGAYLGCLPMFLQMPIWIALWQSLQTTFELRQADFLWGALWFHDLSRPDRLIAFANPLTIPLVGWQVHSINLLPILLAGVFYLQQEFTPKPPATTPEQETQQKMMKWMSLLFPIFLYSQPSGLNLYIFTSTGIGIIEAKRIRDHIKQKEAEEKAGKILIDAPKGMKKRDDDIGGGGGGGGPKKPKTPTAPKGGFGGWIDQLKQKAEQLQRDADRQRGK
jgi:YidC/Oxa1 family membrane protein insertase